MAYNDLINITFEDGATYSRSSTHDILGVVMPYHWGPDGEVNVFDKKGFYQAYPEAYNAHHVTEPAGAPYAPYAQIKSYFANGGSHVAIYRPAGTLYGVAIGSTGSNLAFKYTGIPCIQGTLALVATAGTGSNYTVKLTSTTGEVATVVESFIGQVSTPGAVDDNGEPTYLPTILEKRSVYMQITTENVTAIATSVAPSTPSGSAWQAFALGDTLIPTQFIEYHTEIDAYSTSVAFIGESDNSAAAGKFILKVLGKESISVFNKSFVVDCNAGVAGAYAKITAQVHTNQIASGRTYGAYVGTLTTVYTFANATANMALGKITVFNSPTGPQIFGTRNTIGTGDANPPYYGRANVSRVLAAILREVVPACMDVIHTDTADNDVSRRAFESKLNTIVGGYIATSDLKSDSMAICNGDNNGEIQTQHGTILNVILALHFIGLVERVNIRVIATDSGTTISYV